MKSTIILGKSTIILLDSLTHLPSCLPQLDNPNLSPSRFSAAILHHLPVRFDWWYRTFPPQSLSHTTPPPPAAAFLWTICHPCHHYQCCHTQLPFQKPHSLLSLVCIVFAFCFVICLFPLLSGKWGIKLIKKGLLVLLKHQNLQYCSHQIMPVYVKRICSNSDKINSWWLDEHMEVS